MLEQTDTLVGTVVKISGKKASVRVGAETRTCHLRGRMFARARRSTQRTQIAIGDEVELTRLGEDEGVIQRVGDRRNALVRQVGQRPPKLQVLAANVDQIVIVSALTTPTLKIGLVDRYLVIAHDADIAPALCLNKVDLDDGGALAAAEAALEPYRALGYPVVWTSAKGGEGIESLRELLRGKRSVLAGHSGVGKSKLASAVQPGLSLSSGSVDRRGKGRHTTSASTLFSLDFGGELVDTPGVRELSIQHVPKERLAVGFVEFRPFLIGCHFSSCRHMAEPSCRVKTAVEDGDISRTRYESYVGLYEEIVEGSG